jgi:hypothetical protein
LADTDRHGVVTLHRIDPIGQINRIGGHGNPESAQDAVARLPQEVRKILQKISEIGVMPPIR